MAKAKHLYNRNGVYYFRAIIRGRIVQRSIGKVSKEYAAKVARDWYQKALQERLEETLGDTNRAISTLGELFRVYEEAALRRGEPRPATVRGNINSMRNVIRHAKGNASMPADKIDAMPLNVLDENLVTAYVSAMLKRKDDQHRARRTIASTLTQARSILSNKMRDEYKRLNVPKCVDDFRTVYAGRRDKKRYRLPPRELRDATAAAAERLRNEDPALRMVYLLCFHVGLRSKEATSARWNWFEVLDDGRVFMHILHRPAEGFTCKGYEGTVPVPVAVWNELREYSTDDTYVLPGRNPTERENLIKRRFSEWMRSIGWDQATYPKAAHELRKLIGSMWYKTFGADGARDRLRHAEIQTTLDHYAHLDYTEMEALK